MAYTTENIRNIAVAGHGATGKTSFVEQLLVAGKAIATAAPVESGKTVSDYTPEEIENGLSIHTSVSNIDWNGKKINIFDTPGASDFVGEVVTAFRAAESAVMMIGARAGVQIETIKLWRRLNNRNMPRIAFINKMDEERASYEGVLNDLRDKFDITVVPITIPVGEGADFRGVLDLIGMKMWPAGSDVGTDIPDDMKDLVETYRAQLIEAAAEGDDELTMKFLEEESLTEEEVHRGITEGLRDNKIVPVFCGSALQDAGINVFLDFISWAAPSPAGVKEAVVTREGSEEEYTISTDAPFSAMNFKTTLDQFSGKLSFIKVMGGRLTSDTEFAIDRDGKKLKAGKFYTAVGKKLSETNELIAGDIGIMAKIGDAHTNDTFHAVDTYTHFRPLALPQPVYSLAISAESKKDEDKLNEQLVRVTEEDKTFTVTFDPETHETVIAGMGELHINTILNKIKASQKIEVETRPPRVAYRETITKSTETSYRHKKQSGGHGQFGEVHIRVRPLERGEEYAFANEIKGGSVSKGYVPGIEKGLHEAMEHGVLAGYPVRDVGIVLFDGKEHPVDSSEMAFKIAARGALRQAMEKCGPVLLEPIMKLSVFIEEQYLGDVLSDLSSKRGRVLGQDQLGGGIVEIDALVPQAELLRYAIDLKSMTAGTGSFEMVFDHYDPVQGKIADDIIAASTYNHEED
ncbi:MAG: elongation factor G [Alkalispirochaeta sp.]